MNHTIKCKFCVAIGVGGRGGGGRGGRLILLYTQDMSLLYLHFGHTCEFNGYLFAAPPDAPPARAGAQQHTKQSSAKFYLVAMFSHGKLTTWKRRLREFSENTFLLIF
jgi:hypothetical protein